MQGRASRLHCCAKVGYYWAPICTERSLAAESTKREDDSLKRFRVGHRSTPTDPWAVTLSK